jgi:Bacterial transcriptional activator domain/LysM domain
VTSTQTDPARGPERFSRAAAGQPAEHTETSALKALGAGVALVVMLVGVPVGLWLLTGPPPYPEGMPTRSDLTQPVTVDTVLAVLRAVVWLAWAQFAVCTLIETVSLVRGRGLPRPVPLSGRSQHLARALVGTLLVGGVLAGSTGTSVAATFSTPSVAPVSVAGTGDADRVSPARAEVRADDRTEDVTGASARDDRRAMHAGVPGDMTDVIGKKVYVVQPPDGSYHDNLWDIAERHLDNGRRWQEIFDLNKGRLQPDGGELVLGRLIQPGWVLIMPGDAKGLDRVEAAPVPAAGATSAPVRGTAGDGQAERAGDVDRAESRHESTLARDLTGGGIVAAGLLGALLAERRRRRSAAPDDDALEAEVALLVGADRARAERLDRALRGLSATCRAEQRALPPVFAVSVEDDTIDLRLAPARTDAPTPWTPVDDGRVWRLASDAEEPAELGHAPYPGLVCVGRGLDGTDVLVDLESVGGAVAVTGHDTTAREVVSALAVQLATAPWTDEQRVHGHGLSEVLADLAGDRLLLVDDFGPLLERLEASTPQRGAQEVLTGRLARRPGVVPQYAVLGAPPEPALADRLAALTGAGARGFGVITAGESAGTRWRLEVDESGTMTVPLLDVQVEAVRLTARSTELVTELFERAREEAPVVVDGRVRVPAPTRPGDDGHWSAAGVRIGVLGRIEARTPGDLDPTRVDLAVEMATFLALQSAPVHPTVLAASVWPRGVTPEVRDATVERVREWLGDDAEGSPLLRSDDDGRLSLSRDVAVDWAAFCELAQRSRQAASREERELLRRALQLVRGELLEDRPAGRYTWLPRTRLESVVPDLVVDTAHRLVELCGQDGDPTGAAAAAQAGLRAAPASQLLWRDLIRAEHDSGGHAAAAEAASRMADVLTRRNAHIEAETDALVDELLPTQVVAGE